MRHHLNTQLSQLLATLDVALVRVLSDRQRKAIVELIKAVENAQNEFRGVDL